MMKINEDSAESVFDTLNRQLNSFWKTEVDIRFFKERIEQAIQKTKVSFDASNRKYYLNQGFSVLNTAVYSVFLYIWHMTLEMPQAYRGGVLHWRTNCTISIK